MEDRTCTLEGCDRRAFCRGWCRSHYRIWQEVGDPLARDILAFRDPREAFAARTEWRDGCLVWTGASVNGYGSMRVNGHHVLAHRFAWEQARGPIPEGFEIDHICHTVACCNVDHLRLATSSQNGRNLSGAKRTNKLGVRNVYRDRLGGYCVGVGGSYVGRFPSVAQAAWAAEQARTDKFGAFAGRG